MSVGPFSHLRLRFAEWLLAAITVSLGLILLWTDNLFENPFYWGLARITDETTWGIAALIVGMLRLAALFINGAWEPSPMVRTIMSMLTCFLWVQLSLGLLGGEMSLGVAVYPWLLIADMYSTFRAASDAGVVREAKHCRRGSNHERVGGSRI